MSKSTSIIEEVKINNTKLVFSISQNQQKKPIILYLHGGPGDSCIPLTKKFNADLEEDFTFINLDQRGAGLSYYPFSEEENLTIQVILDDIYEFICYLLERLKQEKLVIMGHSWGSALGLLFIQEHPELVSQYIGIGQVVDMKKNIQCQKVFLVEKMKNITAIERLNLEQEPVSAILFLTKKIVAYGGSLNGHKNYRKLITPFIFSKDYSLWGLIHRLRGSEQSIKFFMEELVELSFNDCLSFKVPITFCEGRNDFHVSSKLVAEYAKKIVSPNQIIWFEQSGHFPQWEEPTKFNREIKTLLDKNK